MRVLGLWFGNIADMLVGGRSGGQPMLPIRDMKVIMRLGVRLVLHKQFIIILTLSLPILVLRIRGMLINVLLMKVYLRIDARDAVMHLVSERIDTRLGWMG